MKQQAITSLPLSPEVERRNRMIKYSIAMSVRVVCIVMMLFVQGWWLLVFATAAIVLPYFAVVLANVHTDPRGGQVERPGGILPVNPRPPADETRDSTPHSTPHPTEGERP